MSPPFDPVFHSQSEHDVTTLSTGRRDERAHSTGERHTYEVTFRVGPLLQPALMGHHTSGTSW